MHYLLSRLFVKWSPYSCCGGKTWEYFIHLNWPGPQRIRTQQIPVGNKRRRRRRERQEGHKAYFKNYPPFCSKSHSLPSLLPLPLPLPVKKCKTRNPQLRFPFPWMGLCNSIPNPFQTNPIFPFLILSSPPIDLLLSLFFDRCRRIRTCR